MIPQTNFFFLLMEWSSSVVFLNTRVQFVSPRSHMWTYTPTTHVAMLRHRVYALTDGIGALIVEAPGKLLPCAACEGKQGILEAEQLLSPDTGSDGCSGILTSHNAEQ